MLHAGLLGIPRSPHDLSGVSASFAQQAPGAVRASSSTATPVLPQHALHQPAPSNASTAAADLAAAAATATWGVSSHHPLFQHAEPDSLSYSMGRSVSLGGGGGPVPSSAGGSQDGGFVEYSKPGQMSGELGLFTREMRRYTMVALAESVIWRIDAATLDAMATQDPQAFIVLQKVALSYASHRLHCLVFHGQLHSV